MEWRKSSLCSADTATEQCIEIAAETRGALLMRSNLRPTEVITVTSDEFATFVAGVKAGEFDDLT